MTDSKKQGFAQERKEEKVKKFDKSIDDALPGNNTYFHEMGKTLTSIIDEMGNETIHQGKSDNEKLLWYMTKSFTHGTNEGGIIKEYFEEDSTDPKKQIIKKIEAILSRQHENKLQLYEYLMSAVGQQPSARYWITKTIEEGQAKLEDVKTVLQTNGFNEKDINKSYFGIETKTGPKSQKNSTVSIKTQSGGKKKKRK